MKISQNDRSGEIDAVLIRGSCVFPGYTGERDHTIDWFDTGDLGYKKDGNFYIIGRHKDSLVINGRNFYTMDIENSLLKHFKIKQCYVVTDQLSLYIFIIPDNKTTVENTWITKIVLENFGISPTALYQLPPNEVPKTTSGKPMKQAILKNIKSYEKWRIT